MVGKITNSLEFEESVKRIKTINNEMDRDLYYFWESPVPETILSAFGGTYDEESENRNIEEYLGIQFVFGDSKCQVNFVLENDTFHIWANDYHGFELSSSGFSEFDFSDFSAFPQEFILICWRAFKRLNMPNYCSLLEFHFTITEHEKMDILSPYQK